MDTFRTRESPFSHPRRSSNMEKKTMATCRTKAFHTHRRSHYRRQNAPNVRAFALAIILISATALFGCGGGISTTEQQGNSTPGTGTGTGTGSGTGAARLTWSAPTTYVNGDPLAGLLAGYKVYYGTTPGVYTSVIDVGNVNSYQINGLTKGQTYHFTVTDYDINRVESDYSTVVSKIIS